MGYCYTKNGLVCDICGIDRSVTKRHCTHGWCPPTAMCPSCWATYQPRWKSLHAKCEAPARECRERRDTESRLLASGEAVRCSAMQIGDATKVHVLFRRADGSCEGYLMLRQTYRQIEILTPATPADFRQHGELWPAEDNFDRHFQAA